MTLSVETVSRIQIEVMSGASWNERSDQVPSTDEARQMWDDISRNLADMRASGGSADVLHEVATRRSSPAPSQIAPGRARRRRGVRQATG